LRRLDENQLAKRIERKAAGSRRRSSALNFVLCAALLILGIALILLIMTRWFIVF
jgi:hypothetical protein